MYSRLHEKGFEVVAFPCGQFGNQEFDDPQEIKNFVKTFGVKFPMMQKIEVNGKNTHPVFQYLKYNTPEFVDRSGNLLPIGWNFGKFLVDKDGYVVSYHGTKTNPIDMEPQILQVMSGELHGKPHKV
eukprot:Lankesteria_metandrocarpae@DN4424_c0_g1_i1.p1